MMGKRADWSEWTPQQLAALLHLDFAMPLHEGYLRYRLNVRGNTITSLERRGLARRDFYRDPCIDVGVPFISLTQFGDEVRRDYVLWHRRVRDQVRSLPAAMAPLAEARL